MQNDISNLIWQLIQTVIAFLSLGVAIYAIFLQRKCKELSYDYTPISLKTLRILASDEEYHRYFPQDASPDAKVICIRFINSGNVPILSEDFVKPLNVCPVAPAEIIAVDGPIVHPKELQSSVSIRQNELSLSPTLLNPSDWIMLNILMENFTGVIKVTGHIVGVSNIIKRRMRWPRSVWGGLGIAAGVYFVNFALTIYLGREYLPGRIILPLLMIATVALYVSHRGFNRFLDESSRLGMFEHWKIIKKVKGTKQSK